MSVGSVSSIDNNKLYTLVETLTFSSSTSVTSTQDLTTYKQLKLAFSTFSNSSSGQLRLRVNGDSTNGNYGSYSNDGSSTTTEQTNGIALQYFSSTSYGPALIDIYDSNNNTIVKTFSGLGGNYVGDIKGFWNSTAAITSVTVVLVTGGVTTTGTVKIYGIVG